MKEKYEEPIMEIVEFETEDIVTASSLSFSLFPEDDGGWGNIN